MTEPSTPAADRPGPGRPRGAPGRRRTVPGWAVHRRRRRHRAGDPEVGPDGSPSAPDPRGDGALHQPRAVLARIRRPPAGPGRRRPAAPARAGQVPGHLLRGSRRVLPGAGGRTRGPGGGRAPHPLTRRPAARPSSWRPSPRGSPSWWPARAGSSPTASPGAGRAGVVMSRLAHARRRRPGPPRRRVQPADLSGADAVGRRPRPPLPVHLQPLASTWSSGWRPRHRRGADRPGQGAAAAAPVRGPARRQRGSCPSSR